MKGYINSDSFPYRDKRVSRFRQLCPGYRKYYVAGQTLAFELHASRIHTDSTSSPLRYKSYDIVPELKSKNYLNLNKSCDGDITDTQGTYSGCYSKDESPAKFSPH